MKFILKHILTLATALSFISCSMNEIGVPVPDSGNTIEIIARPTSFITTNVTTKAAKEGWEAYVYNAYLLLFDGDGRIISGPRELKISGNAILPYRFTLDEGSFSEAYILANIPLDFDMSVLNTTESIKSAVLNLDYMTGDDYIAAPTLDGTNPSLPMMGTASLSNKKDNKVVIGLESLFAKVNLTVKMNLKNSTGLLNRASFKLTKINAIDLPEKVSLIAPQNESAWVKEVGASEAKEPNETIYEGENTADELLGTVTEHKTCCYVPEYYLSPIDSPSAKEQDKPSNYDQSKHPVRIEVNGELTHDDLNDGTVPFTYTLYLGENNVDDFNIKRNKSYNYLMTITGIDEARLEQDERIDVVFETENLAARESANCYVISKIGRYEFPAVKGNTSESIGTVGENTDGTIIHDLITDNTGNTVTNVRLIDGNITFDVNMDNFSAISNGNTMLLVKDANGKILWSWHLWFDGGFYDTSLSPISYETYNTTTGATMMNRNIGAASQGSTGLYYKWGDKSPYFNGAYQGGITGGAWNSEEKTITDPCPPGYKVPSNAVWFNETKWQETFAGGDNSQEYSGGGFIYDFNNPRVFYPLSSYYQGNSLFSGNVGTTTEISEEFGVGNYQISIQVTFSYNYHCGAAWSIDNTENLYYEVRKQAGTPIVDYYIYNGTSYTESELSSASRFTKKWLLWQAINAAKNTGTFDNIIDAVIKDDFSYTNSMTFNPSHGLQVRCVSTSSTVQ